MISDDEDGENGAKTSWRAASDTKVPQRQQQQPSPPSSPDERHAPRQGLAGLVASGKITPTKTGKTTTTTPPSISFSEAINRTKGATNQTAAEKAQPGGPNSSSATPTPPKLLSPPAQTTAPQRGNGNGAAAAAEDDNEDTHVDVTRRIPGSFDFGNYGTGSNGNAGGNIADPYDAVTVLGNLWQRMQLKKNDSTG